MKFVQLLVSLSCTAMQTYAQAPISLTQKHQPASSSLLFSQPSQRWSSTVSSVPSRSSNTQPPFYSVASPTLPSLSQQTTTTQQQQAQSLWMSSSMPAVLHELMLESWAVQEESSAGEHSSPCRLYLMRVHPNYILCCYNHRGCIKSDSINSDPSTMKRIPWGLMRRKARSVHTVLEKAMLKLNPISGSGRMSGERILTDTT